MKRFWKSLCAGALTLGMGVTSIAPASAMPQPAAPVAPAASTASDAQPAQFREDGRRLRRDRRFERRLDRAERRFERRSERRFGRDFERRGSGYYYRGYRGYRNARPGYRYYNGYYFPGAAFIAGAIIGGAINNGVRPRGNAHVEWCFNRYRSYRASDNTFQPNSGPRRQCNSPYN